MGVVFPFLIGDLKTFDVMYQGYSWYDVKHILESHGPQGRLRYYYVSRYLDNILPIIHTSFLLGVIFSLNLDHNSKLKNKIIKSTLIMLSIGAALSDWLENDCIRQFLLAYPDVSISLVELASCCTIIKWMSLALTSIGITLVVMLRASSYEP